MDKAQEVARDLAGSIGCADQLGMIQKFAAILRDHDAEVRRKTIKECIKVICGRCASGNRPNKFGKHVGVENGSWSGEPRKYDEPCKAAALRSRKE